MTRSCSVAALNSKLSRFFLSLARAVNPADSCAGLLAAAGGGNNEKRRCSCELEKNMANDEGPKQQR
jgi:hypothetical protein